MHTRVKLSRSKHRVAVDVRSLVSSLMWAGWGCDGGVAA